MTDIRPARPDEADELAALLWRVRADNADSIPAPVHSLDETRRWMREVVVVECDVWVGVDDGRVVALLVLRPPDWIEQLYVDAAHAGHGLGTALLEVAERELPGGAQLWTFQTNTGARRFYERHGFVAVEWTDGDNEERAPDVRYVRSP